MKFMISFTHTRGEWADRVPRWQELTKEDKQAIADHVRQFNETLQSEQNVRMVFFDAPENARTLRMHPDGSVNIEDGPLVNGNEFVGGYFIIEAASMDEALDWARRGRWLVGSNEIREIKDIPV
jgi:hypothetical protein